MNLNELSKEELEARKEFVKVLGEYAKQWVNEIQNTILEHVEELYQDKSFCIILNEWKIQKDRCDKFNKDEFLNAYLNGRKVTYCKPSFDYNDTLYLLCVKRFK